MNKIKSLLFVAFIGLSSTFSADIKGSGKIKFVEHWGSVIRVYLVEPYNKLSIEVLPQGNGLPNVPNNSYVDISTTNTQLANHYLSMMLTAMTTGKTVYIMADQITRYLKAATIVD